MAASFPNPNSDSGLKKLDEHLLTRSYITGYQASKDDIAVFTALANPPCSEYVNASRWYNHIDALLRISAEGSGVIVEGSGVIVEGVLKTLLIKLVKMSFELPGDSLLFEKCKSDIEEKSSEVLKEAIIDLNLEDLIKIVQVSESADMPKLLKVVVDHLEGKSRDDLSKMVSTRCEIYERELILDKAEKTLRKTNEAANNKFLKKWKKLFKALVFPNLEDEGLIRFRIACRGASRLVDPEIRSRYISLRKNEQPNDVHIKLENMDGSSANVSLRGSLESSILCAERVKNIEKYGVEVSFTHYTFWYDDQYQLQLFSGYCEAASSEDANALPEWAVNNLENASNDSLLDIMRIARELGIKGLVFKAAENMAQRLMGSGQDLEMGRILGVPHEVVSIDDYEGFADDINDIRPFLELMIPMLNDVTYLRFAGLHDACAAVVNEVQARKCYRQDPDHRKISLVCSNGKTVEAIEAVIALSGLIKSKQLENPYEDTLQIDLQSTTEILLKWINLYCVKHTNANVSVNQLRIWDANFLKNANANALFTLAKGAMEMKIRILVDLVSQTLAAMINNKTVREMRASFNLKNDLRSCAEKEWRQKHEWAFQSDPLPAPVEGIEVVPLGLSLTEEDFLAALPESEREELARLLAPVKFNDEDSEEDEEAA